MVEQLIQYLSECSVLLLGFGREGRSSYDFIRRHLPEKALGIADKNPITLEDPLVRSFTGENYLDAMGEYELVLKSPGIPFAGVTIPDGVTVTCQTDLFLRYADCICVGVTGTKGKTTTATLTHAMLVQQGIPALLMGNMGLPVLDSIEDAQGKTAVLELSSHQLQFMRVSPHIAILTNLFEDHLDHYDGGFAGYADAKMNIRRWQTKDDVFFCNDAQDYSAYPAGAGRCVKISLQADDPFLDALAAENERLHGRHNATNLRFCAAAARELGVQDAAIARAVRAFQGIEHRMEPVGTYRGIRFYNDAINTIPQGTPCVMEGIGDVDSLIFGGLDRGVDYSGFAEYLNTCMAQNLIALPETGHILAARLREMGCTKNLVPVADMEAAVAAAYKLTAAGKACLLSPAASSYNVYRDFTQKGGHFKALVKQLGMEGV